MDEAIKCKHCGEMLKIKCPFCAEEIIRSNDDKCSLCGESLTKTTTLNKKLVESTGFATFVSLIIPGLGQLLKGEIGKGLTYFLLAIVLGSFTVGIGWILMVIISLCDASNSLYKCPNCRTTVDKQAIICKNCQTSLG